MQTQKRILIFILTAFVSNIAIAQDYQTNTAPSTEQIKEATMHYKALANNGILLVKIPTEAKKLAKINQSLAITPHNNRLLKLKKTELLKVEKAQKGLMEGFKQFYTFSEVVAIYDTNYTRVLDNPSAGGVFFNTDFKALPSFSLAGKAFFTFRKDQVYYADNRARIAYVLTDHKGVILPYPFPSSIPYRFKKLPLIPDTRPFFLGAGNLAREDSEKRKYFSRYKSKKMDKNPYYAIAKMLQLKMEVFDAYLNKIRP